MSLFVVHWGASPNCFFLILRVCIPSMFLSVMKLRTKTRHLQPVFRIRIHLIRIRDRIKHFRLNTDPDPGFWWSKIKKFLSWTKLAFFGSKTTVYLSLGLHKGRPSYRRSLQPSKENIQYFKTWNFLIIFLFLWTFLPSWIRIRIRTHWPDWIRINKQNQFFCRKKSRLSCSMQDSWLNGDFATLDDKYVVSPLSQHPSISCHRWGPPPFQKGLQLSQPLPLQQNIAVLGTRIFMRMRFTVVDSFKMLTAG